MSSSSVETDRMPVPAQATDEELFARLQRGDDAAFEDLVRRYEGELFSYLKRYLGDSSLAEDVFQNTFLQVYQKRQLYELGRRVRPWMYAVATHQAIDALRRQKRFTRLSLENTAPSSPESDSGTLGEQLESRGLAPDAAAKQSEMRLQVRRAVDELPDHLKSVVIMAYFQELKHKDISAALSIPVGTVKSRLFAAVRQLEAKWVILFGTEEVDPS